MTSSAQGGVGLAGSYNTIGGTAAGEANVISGNTSGIGVGGTNNSVIGNVIGLQKDGSTYVTSHAQQTGVDISGTNNTVGGANAQRNIISGNEYSGVTITYPGATGNVVKGNYIGLQSNGTSFVTSSTQNYGAYLYDACMYNTIGGTAAGEGNIISGNNDGAAGGYGIYLGSALDYNPESVSSNTIIGNTIGPQADGSTVVTSSTQKYGIYFYDFGDGEYMSNNVIGGNVSGARNIISANTEAGIYISNYTTGASIKGNYIGLASNGTSAIATSSQDYGIYISGGASSNSNTIGGTASAEENTVTGNTNSGIYLNGVSSHTILGNVIGLNRGGLGEVNSDQDYGIYLANGSTNNQIGSGTTGARNIISLNNTAGILLTGASTSGNSIKGNKIGIGSDEDASGISYTIGQRTGISCHSSAHSNTIGGTTSGEGNTISDNGDQLNDSNGTGILLSSVTSHTILGNIIGLNPDGVSEVSTANSSGQGVGIDISNSYGNLIGNGTSSGRNIISGHEYVLTFGYNAWGISISGSSSGNNIKGNYIGLGSDGSTKASNDIGVYLSGTSNGNTIGGTTAGEGNVISGNINSGIILESSGVDNVFGNHIGTQANGMSYVSSNTQLNGIYVNSNNQTIGGNGSGKRNIIGGNETAGIYINTNMTGTIIKGNYIGVGTDGASGIASSSQDAGIHLLSGANGTQIGGTSAGDGNVISANYGALSSGIIFFNNNNNNVVIKGNIIGLAADGTSGTSNYYQNIGIRVVSNTLGLQIGGVSAAEKNIISGNTQNGIRLFSTTTTGAKIQGNYIGCTSTGSAPTGTVQAYGIYISNGNIGNAIGGNSGATGQNPYGNVIAHNGTAGVYLTGASCTGNLISRNLIYSNASGVTLASSANASKAKPSVTAFNGTSVSGTATANDTVEVFKNNTGNCQDAMTYLGSVLANGSGAWSLSGVTINNGESVTATAHSIRQQYL
ncbi:MAG: hypothetical protein J0M08_03240 [Bacteroidetes bacterium]|nr:hypothetical protein [Bacteroidota bacterium]